MKVLSPLLEKYGMNCANPLSQWRKSENLWCARASLVPFTNVAAKREYYPHVEKCAAALIAREERFGKTAAGWVLRDVSRYNADLVDSFIDEHLSSFSIESLRNATKYYETRKRKKLIAEWKDSS